MHPDFLFTLITDTEAKPTAKHFLMYVDETDEKMIPASVTHSLRRSKIRGWVRARSQ